MVNPVQLSLVKDNGESRQIIIEPVLKKDEKGIQNTGLYKIYKDAFGEESALFTEPLEINEPNNGLPDTDNPDFLGKFFLDGAQSWKYEGDLLSDSEQKQVVMYILAFKEA